MNLVYVIPQVIPFQFIHSYFIYFFFIRSYTWSINPLHSLQVPSRMCARCRHSWRVMKPSQRRGAMPSCLPSGIMSPFRCWSFSRTLNCWYLCHIFDYSQNTEKLTSVKIKKCCRCWQLIFRLFIENTGVYSELHFCQHYNIHQYYNVV